jgi:arabinose-5-phosphate isomerase
MPKVDVEDSIYDVIVEISHKRLGATIVMSNQEIVGIITDGDIRRIIEKKIDLDSLSAKDIMNDSPKTIQKEDLAIDGLKIMEKNTISQIVVLDGRSYVGIVHIHDMLKEGIL